MPEKITRSEIVSAKVTPELRRNLEKRAKEKGWTLSHLIANILESNAAAKNISSSCKK
jgi:predicted DNA-binding ribbon-helix-helix protein